MDSPLCFIALLPSQKIHDEITAFKQYMFEQYNARVALRSPVHITLYPPFKWSDEKFELLNTFLYDFAASQNQFPVMLNGFDCFKPSVVYIKVEENDALIKLQKNLTFALQKYFSAKEFPSQSRPYLAHITIANRDLQKKFFLQAWNVFKNKIYTAAFTVTHITLLKHNGKIWDVYNRYSTNTK